MDPPESGPQMDLGGTSLGQWAALFSGDTDAFNEGLRANNESRAVKRIEDYIRGNFIAPRFIHNYVYFTGDIYFDNL